MPDTNKAIPVIEIFGPVIQGEGAMAGQQTHFLRTGGCDFRCTWCDSMYAVDPKEVKKNATKMTAHEILAKLRARGDKSWVRTVTLSGGNPTMHDLSDIVWALQKEGWFIALETQGTLRPAWVKSCDLVTVSPKPPSAQVPFNWEALGAYCEDDDLFTVLKVVVFTDDDYAFAKQVHMRFPDKDFFITPGTSQDSRELHPDDQLATIQEDILHCTKYFSEKLCNDPEMCNVKIMPQLHALMFGYERGT